MIKTSKNEKQNLEAILKDIEDSGFKKLRIGIRYENQPKSITLKIISKKN